MSEFQKVLALDTAMNGCGVTVYRGGDGSVVSRSMPMPRGQAEHLIPLIQSALNEAGLSFSDLEAIITTAGPGAFTGLRIGISTARSLALALSIPVYGITTLQVFALQYIQEPDFDGALAVLIDTKRDDFYVQLFDTKGQALEEALALSADGVVKYLGGRSCIFIGDAVGRFQEVLGDAMPGGQYDGGYDLPDTEVMAQVLIDGSFDYINENPVPIYLRDADVSQSKKPQRVLGTVNNSSVSSQ